MLWQTSSCSTPSGSEASWSSYVSTNVTDSAHGCGKPKPKQATEDIDNGWVTQWRIEMPSKEQLNCPRTKRWGWLMSFIPKFHRRVLLVETVSHDVTSGVDGWREAVPKKLHRKCWTAIVVDASGREAPGAIEVPFTPVYRLQVKGVDSLDAWIAALPKRGRNEANRTRRSFAACGMALHQFPIVPQDSQLRAKLFELYKLTACRQPYSDYTRTKFDALLDDPATSVVAAVSPGKGKDVGSIVAFSALYKDGATLRVLLFGQDYSETSRSSMCYFQLAYLEPVAQAAGDPNIRVIENGLGHRKIKERFGYEGVPLSLYFFPRNIAARAAAKLLARKFRPELFVHDP